MSSKLLDKMLKEAKDKAAENRDAIINAVKLDGRNLEFSHESFRADYDIVDLALDNYCFSVQWASKELRDNPDLMYKALAPPNGNKKTLQYASDRLKSDFLFMERCCQAEGLALKYGSKEVRANKEVVLAAVRQTGHTLYYASESLKSNKEVVLAAIKQDGYSLLSASEKLKQDRDLVLEAVKGDGLVFMTVADALQADKEIAMEAVKNNGMALEFATLHIRKQRPIVLEAVKQNGHALRFANEIYRADRILVRFGVMQKCGDSFEGTDHLSTPEEWLHWAKTWVKDLCEAEWPPKSKTREEVLAEVEVQRIARSLVKPQLQNKLSKDKQTQMTGSRRRSIILIAQPSDDASANLPEGRKLRLGSMFGQESLCDLVGSSKGTNAGAITGGGNDNATQLGLLRIQQAMLGAVEPATSLPVVSSPKSPLAKLGGLFHSPKKGAVGSPTVSPFSSPATSPTKHRGRFTLSAFTKHASHA
jgi:hypothetical protein